MLPLKGLKVVDLTTFLATPTTGRVLGEWGADVIKVEAFKGDPCRTNQAVVFGMPSSDEKPRIRMANFHKRYPTRTEPQERKGPRGHDEASPRG